MNEITSTRHNHLIDPTMHVWGWEIPLYLFLGGVVAGIMIFTGIRLFRGKAEETSTAMALLPWTAPVAISLGMFFLWLDLEHPFNAWRFYMALKLSSPMSWEPGFSWGFTRPPYCWHGSPRRSRGRSGSEGGWRACPGSGGSTGGPMRRRLFCRD